MSKLPAFDGKKLIKVLGVFGFEVIRIKGSHHFLRHQTAVRRLFRFMAKNLSEPVSFIKF